MEINVDFLWGDKHFLNSNFAHRFCLCTLKIRNYSEPPLFKDEIRMT